MGFLGRFLTGALFVAYPVLVWLGLREGSPRRVALVLLAVLVPTLVICLVATFSSPEFAFLKEEWDVIPASIGLALLTVVLLASITLAVSFTERANAVTGMARPSRDRIWSALSLSREREIASALANV